MVDSYLRFHKRFPLSSHFNNVLPVDIRIFSLITVTTQLAETLLSEDLRVIVAVPTPLAVTKPPLEVTVATELLLLVHTVPSVVFDGFIVLLK